VVRCPAVDAIAHADVLLSSRQLGRDVTARLVSAKFHYTDRTGPDPTRKSPRTCRRPARADTKSAGPTRLCRRPGSPTKLSRARLVESGHHSSCPVASRLLLSSCTLVAFQRVLHAAAVYCILDLKPRKCVTQTPLCQSHRGSSRAYRLCLLAWTHAGVHLGHTSVAKVPTRSALRALSSGGVVVSRTRRRIGDRFAAAEVDNTFRSPSPFPPLFPFLPSLSTHSSPCSHLSSLSIPVTLPSYFLLSNPPLTLPQVLLVYSPSLPSLCLPLSFLQAGWLWHAADFAVARRCLWLL